MPLATALAALRIGTACLFLAHAVVRIVDHTIPRFAAFMGNLGFPAPTAVVWIITLVELTCGLLVLAGYKARYSALGLLAIAGGGIVLIHAKQGWFVGEHGTGGSEYSVSLILALCVLIAADGQAATTLSAPIRTTSGVRS